MYSPPRYTPNKTSSARKKTVLQRIADRVRGDPVKAAALAAVVGVGGAGAFAAARDAGLTDAILEQVRRSKNKLGFEARKAFSYYILGRTIAIPLALGNSR